MHHVKVPPSVALIGKRQKVDDDGKVVLVDEKIRETSMHDFVSDTITNDAYFGRSAKLLLAAMRICSKFEAVAPGELVELEDADYDHVKSVLDAPSGGWNVAVMKQYMPFVRAFLEALDDEAFKKVKAMPVAIAPVAAS